MKTYKFQAITFKDHFHANEDWIIPARYNPKAFLMTYYGWVTYEDADMVVLSHGTHEDDGLREFDSHMHIMKECIVKRTTYKIDLF